MSEATLQSRKICFVHVDPTAYDFFDGALPGHDVSFGDGLVDVPEDTEILSVFIEEKVTEEFLQRHPALKMLAARSTALDHVDLEACQRAGITVTNVVGYGENTVAEHTFALILALSRRLRDSDEAVRTGRFERYRLQGFDLRGRTLGVIGAGRIGCHVIRLATAFGMKVLAYESTPHPFLDEMLGFSHASLEDLLEQSHVVTLHVPLTAETTHMINRESLTQFRRGAILINTARGGLMDTEAVIEALDDGRLGGLGLDVLEDERVFQGGVTSILGEKIAARVRGSSAASLERQSSPSRLQEFSRLVTHSRLLNRTDVVLTPHVAYNSVEAFRGLRQITAESIRDFIEGKPLQYRIL